METTITNALQTFTNEDINANIRAIMIDNEAWFVAKDICESFGDTNYRRSVTRLDEDEKALRSIKTSGGQQQMNVVNEAGLYTLLFYMQPQKAKGVSQNDSLINERIAKLRQFKRWITHEVLPSIRKTGKYELPKEPESGRELIARALVEAHKIIADMDSRIALLQPKATAYDAIINKFDSVSWRDFCNKIRDTFNVKENEVREKLIDERWIYRVNTMSGRTKYKPYKETIDRDLMIVKDVLCKDGEVRPCNFFTYKGQQKLIDWFAPVVAVDNEV